MTAPRPTFNYDSPLPDAPASYFAARPQLPYIIPFFCFLIFFIPSALPTIGGINFEKLWFNWHPFIYAAKTLTAAILLYCFWHYYTKIRWTHLPLGLLAGLLGTPLWIGTAYLTYALHLSHSPAPDTIYNPDLMLPIDWQRQLFLFIRVAGPTLVVPVMEELFFRDFVFRSLIDSANFQEVPIGKFTWTSLLLMSALFGINHGVLMLLPGFLYGLLMGILLIRTKSLGACITAHATTNLTLYLYCIYTKDWQFM